MISLAESGWPSCNILLMWIDKPEMMVIYTLLIYHHLSYIEDDRDPDW